MSTKFTTVRLTLGGEKFEILVNPDVALSYQQGRKVEISQVIAVEEIFSDSSKGLRVPLEKLVKCFNTDNPMIIAETILQRGDLQLTTEQRRGLIDEKRKQIVSTLTRNFVDPKSGLPHPPLRIEQALEEARVSIDPYKAAEEQTKGIIDRIRTILPLKSENLQLAIKVPPQFVPQSIGALKKYGEIEKEEWGADGSLVAVITIPAGVRSGLLSSLGEVTKGAAEANVVK